MLCLVSMYLRIHLETSCNTEYIYIRFSVNGYINAYNPTLRLLFRRHIPASNTDSKHESIQTHFMQAHRGDGSTSLTHRKPVLEGGG